MDHFKLKLSENNPHGAAEQNTRVQVNLSEAPPKRSLLHARLPHNHVLRVGVLVVGISPHVKSAQELDQSVAYAG